jgi:hypothetical protein
MFKNSSNLMLAVMQTLSHHHLDDVLTHAPLLPVLKKRETGIKNLNNCI